MAKKLTQGPIKQVGMRNGQLGTRINPRGVSQIGSSMSNHSMDSGGKKLTKAVEPVRGASMPDHRLGNETAKAAGQGPGAGRSVMRSGSQAQQGPVAGRSHRRAVTSS